MPLIKRQHAAPALKDAIVLDLGDVSRQAERIRRQAREQADRIIEEAETRARDLTEGAEAAGREQGYAQGYQQGLDEGRQQGHAEALEQHREKLDQLDSAWTQTLSQWHNRRRQLESEAQQGVVELALRIAEKLVHRVVEVDETVVVDQLGSALGHVLRPLEVAVRVHPDDRSVLEAALPRLTAEFRNVNNIELVDDQSLQRGGCVLDFGQGEVDASLETQFERVVRAMLPEQVSDQASDTLPLAGDAAEPDEADESQQSSESTDLLEPPGASDNPEASDTDQT